MLYQVSNLSHLSSFTLLRTPRVHNNEMEPTYLIPMRDIVLQGVVAQTKIAFLIGGRRKSFLALPQKEQELLGAAAVIGSLMYGAGHVFKSQGLFQEFSTRPRVQSDSESQQLPHVTPPSATSDSRSY